eukprot:TRINITY_DN6249_c0_g1_i2.p1 TRINITY_DN6249_c0_g1~~TRINITY_DN6249_c0_g1_i2.p1  ORF type:complete len:195 (+),score=-24.79 TRINITY_DN6249_c0_g1_i2:329-913(+)
MVVLQQRKKSYRAVDLKLNFHSINIQSDLMPQCQCMYIIELYIYQLCKFYQIFHVSSLNSNSIICIAVLIYSSIFLAILRKLKFSSNILTCGQNSVNFSSLRKLGGTNLLQFQMQLKPKQRSIQRSYKFNENVKEVKSKVKLRNMYVLKKYKQPSIAIPCIYAQTKRNVINLFLQVFQKKGVTHPRAPNIANLA